ncbi:hypothetical protein [Halotalea alkalilenta]|uniref:Uncharacterized protein n=1 Tax=Halotalea alkalilenta TaxID=376489 RepID=A0A172YDF6_9GAMM|nr:hypothetical protein [Halotalea alkalilenta]ANF57300.1 hypothetical protein A5892_07340 [Halotalea alkalilenta]
MNPSSSTYFRNEQISLFADAQKQIQQPLRTVPTPREPSFDGGERSDDSARSGEFAKDGEQNTENDRDRTYSPSQRLMTGMSVEK